MATGRLLRAIGGALAAGDHQATPRRLKGIQSPCSGTCQVIQDVANGWEGRCLGLQPYGSNTTATECRKKCCGDSNCEVWQWGNARETVGAALGSCFTGRGLECSSERGDDFIVLAGQRISHGTVGDSVPLELGSWCIGSGMRQATSVSAERKRKSVEQCRGECYDDPGCSIWQIGTSEGCWLGFSDACSKDVPGADTMVAGERVARACKVGLGVDQRTDYVQVFGIIGAVAVAFACMATVALLLCFGGGRFEGDRGKGLDDDSETE